MYRDDDPRSSLSSTTRSSLSAATHDGSTRPPQYVEFDQAAPQETSASGSPTWYARGQNFVLSLTRLKAGDTLARRDQEHEYLVLLPDTGTDVTITAGSDTTGTHEMTLAVIPPGDSAVTAQGDTTVIRLFDERTEDLLARASNAAAYQPADPRVAPLSPWPDPVGGPKLRVYYPDRVAGEPGRFGRIYRTSSFMVNFLDTQQGPRDPEKLSPHHHDDFEQCSLAVEGSFVHHIRTPWTPRRSQWRDDDHRRVGSPSVAIIPPPTTHTTEAIDPGINRLIDIFSPPREDFSAKEGWVLNAAEYPQP